MSEIKPGKGKFAVVGGVAVVRTLDGSERYVYKGGVFDAAQADVESVKHLVSVGLIEEVHEAESAPATEKKATEIVEPVATEETPVEEPSEVEVPVEEPEEAEAPVDAPAKTGKSTKRK